MLVNILLVGIGGFLGSVLRYLAYVLVRLNFAGSFPMATLIVNVIGCMGIGIAFGWAERSSFLYHPQITLFVAVGILGGFTTFSAFGFETIALLKQQQIGLAFTSVMANLTLGFGAVVLGRMLIR